jgi:hypothetical protein
MPGMDKIDFSIASLFNSPDVLKQKSKKTKPGDELKGSGKIYFTDAMKKAINEAGELGPLLRYAPSEEALLELMDAVHSAGSDLLDRPFQDEILNYKRAVRNFIHYVVSRRRHSK